MTSLHNISVQLSNGQKRNLARAYQKNEEVTLRLSKKSLNGSDTLRVPGQVVKRLQKNRNAGKGMEIKILKLIFENKMGQEFLVVSCLYLRQQLPLLENIRFICSCRSS